MIGLVRAATLCATLAFGLVDGAGGGQDIQTRRSRRSRRSSWRPRSRARRGRSPSRARTCGPTPMPPLSAAITGPACKSWGQIAATAPDDSANWLRLARTIFSVFARPAAANRPSCWSAPRPRPTSPISGPPIPARRPTRCGVGRGAVDRKVAPVADACGFRLYLFARSPRCAASTRRCVTSTVSGCWIIPSISTRPRRGPVSSSPRTSPNDRFHAVFGARGQRQAGLCRRKKRSFASTAEHGQRYNINLRAGLPSTVKETLPKSAEFNIYVRDRRPFVRFTGRAYVLPRTGQRGIPVVSVNTPAVSVDVFRIGDRNLINTVIDNDFQQS